MSNLVNCTFNDTVVVNTDTVFDNCVFAVKGSGKKDNTTPGVKVVGDANLTVRNSVFKSTGYQAAMIGTSGKVVLEDNVFNCEGNYNPIEGTVSAGSASNDVTIKNNIFNGVCGNNYINFYKMQDGAIVNIEGNQFTGVSVDSEILRLSNVDNTSATFNVVNNNYTFNDGVATDYTSFIMCQDFTAKNDNPQDFTKYTINIENLECNAQKVTENKVPFGKLLFVYQDGKGILADGENTPTVNLK